MQTFQQFKQEFSLFEQNVLMLQQNQGAERRETVRYKVIKYREKASEYSKLLRKYKKQENESVGNEIKELHHRLLAINIKLNEISYINYQLDKKMPLERIREFATTLLSCLPLFSFTGLIILFLYLGQNNLESDFFSILSETNGIIFLVIIGIWIGVFHLFIPYWITIAKTESITNPNIINNALNHRMVFIPLYALPVLLFSWVSYIFVSPFWFSVIAAIVWCISSSLFHIIYIQIYKMKDHESKMFMPLFLVIVWYFSFIISTSFFNTFIKSNNTPLVKLELFFSTIGFTQNKPYYFKLSKSFSENIDGNEILELRSKYPKITDNQETHRSPYLYGKIIVDLKDIKILCSVKEENGHHFCHRFSSNDLYKMDWIPDIELQKSE